VIAVVARCASWESNPGVLKGEEAILGDLRRGRASVRTLAQGGDLTDELTWVA